MAIFLDCSRGATFFCVRGLAVLVAGRSLRVCEKTRPYQSYTMALPEGALHQRTPWPASSKASNPGLLRRVKVSLTFHWTRRCASFVHGRRSIGSSPCSQVHSRPTSGRQIHRLQRSRAGTNRNDRSDPAGFAHSFNQWAHELAEDIRRQSTFESRSGDWTLQARH